MTFFSIVIPVYNISSYLDDAVGSILRQRFKDFELILVDDGSTEVVNTSAIYMRVIMIM